MSGIEGNLDALAAEGKAGVSGMVQLNGQRRYFFLVLGDEAGITAEQVKGAFAEAGAQVAADFFKPERSQS